MTGALVVIGKGSEVQPLVAVLFQMTFMLTVLKLSPYESDNDDVASFVSSLCICLATLCAMVLITTDSKRAGFDASFLDTFLVFITAATLLFELVLLFLNTKFGFKICRRLASKVNSTDKDKGDSIASKVRVIPTTTNKINATTLREARMTFGAGSQEYQEAARNMK